MLTVMPVAVDSLRVGDVIFLNDLISKDKFGTFYMECYTSSEDGAVLAIDLQSAQILSISRIADAFGLKVRTLDNRNIDLEAHYGQRFSVYVAHKVLVSRLHSGDKILLRGDHSPAHLNKSYQYALISQRYGFVSKVLKVKKSWWGPYRLTVRFAGIKKLRLTVDPGVLFEMAHAPK